MGKMGLGEANIVKTGYKTHTQKTLLLAFTGVMLVLVAESCQGHEMT
jgi:hypothetical protein